MLDTAAVSLALCPSPDGFKWKAELIALLTGLHDIGKAFSCFQHQILDFSGELKSAGFHPTGDAPCRHERISTQFIRNELLNAGMPERDADTVGRAVVAHHGYWVESPCEVFGPYKEAQGELFQLLKTVLGIEEFPKALPGNHSAFGIRLAGHIVLCDWIASSEDFFGDDRLRNNDDPETYFARARNVAQEWIGRLGLERDSQAGKAGYIVENARPIQQTLLNEDIAPGLVIIEAPMGEGKTEAAWILAEKWRDEGYHGMYMALPTMATSDSLYDRYRDTYLKKLGRGEDVKLIYGMAWMRDELEPEKTSEIGEPGDDQFPVAAWFRPTRRAMLAAHGVGTIDQAMLAGMNVKFGFLRLYGLADRVLIIDEVHAYDAYMTAIISRLLQWCACLRIPVILLSATLSSRQRIEMIEAYGATGTAPCPDAPYPLITMAEPGKEAKTIKADTLSGKRLRIESNPGVLGDSERTAALAAELVKEGGCCCVILNTVKQAQAVYAALKISKNEKLLFHSRFTASDRKRIAGRVLDLFGKTSSHRPGRFVLAATQVVEQSLDVDFDHMISEIAPIDLLLQRSGRLHRHRRRELDPTLHVLLPRKGELIFGGTGRVYAEKPLIRTLAILDGRCELQLPDDFRELIERCYGTHEWEQNAIAWEAIRKADQDWDEEIQLLYRQGRQFSLSEPSKRVFRPVNNDPTGDDSDDGNGWRARTRLGANERTAVLVPEKQLLSLEPVELSMRDVRNLYDQSLKLPAYLPIYNPAPGFSPGVQAQGKLRGLILLPVSTEGLWRGIDEKGNLYEIAYNKELGLLAGRVQ